MINEQRIHHLLDEYIGIREMSLNGMYPDPELDFWIPMTKELSKNIDETIVFLQKLEPIKFQYTLETLDELIEKNEITQAS